ncbi:MAG: NUDIX domain-containing protein [Planctomycetota bacterium]
MPDREELFDVVDRAGRVVGAARRSECHGNPALLHRVVHVMVENAEGEILLQLRSSEKDIQPGRWDTAVGGHLARGESVEEALLRETREELGIAVDLPRFTYGYAYVMQNDLESERVHTFCLRHKGPFVHPAKEVSELRFWTREAIRRQLGTGLFTPNFEEEFARFEAWERASPGPLRPGRTGIEPLEGTG